MIREVWRSSFGKAGLLLFSALILTSFYVWITFPKDFGKTVWNNPVYWADNPKNAPPAWLGIFGKEKPIHQLFRSSHPEVISDSSSKTYLYSFKVKHSSRSPFSFLSLSVSEVVFWEIPPTIEVYLERPGEEIFLYRQIIPESQTKEQKPFVRYKEVPNRILLTSSPEIEKKVKKFLNRMAEDGQKLFSVKTMIYFSDPRDEVKELKVILGGEVFGVLGTDSLGRDIFQGLLFGLPIALLIGLITAPATVAIGTILAGISGYYGGKIDNFIQGFIDVVANILLLPILIFLIFVFGPHLSNIILILILFGWTGISIKLRSWVLQIRTSGFIEYARARGFSSRRIIMRHILTQTFPYLFLGMVLSVPAAILSEAGLSFLGLGDSSLPTWGQMLEQSYNTGAVYLGFWWQVLSPGLAIIGTILVFWFIIQALEPIIEPRSGRR